ncbi:60S acidic ribosomal protein P1 [Blastocystis sp. subtype 4]|uniref:60S acidic ribosomal protein P1 n=1 Tax=Blastocystis sp. subtype 4 TaxID=944170 RepID=UPI00071192F7|nr:60S acidic ribosomal protein P1 [Blastocystis sp. subtype 4]KNB41436.1 60S acidic ribosomal protein P1 [Blastocystis sp. subtype 4]|eukprot:XP_014524879.1 60S acidic ribosomal protein P1 [Blastocystis sp. subtype 4]
MAFVAPAEHDEVVCALATLLLADGGVKVLKATNNTVEPYWPMLFAKYLGEKDISELLLKPSCGAAAPVAAAAAAEGEAAEEKKEEKKEEEEEEEDIDMSGGGLFGDDDDDW